MYFPLIRVRWRCWKSCRSYYGRRGLTVKLWRGAYEKKSPKSSLSCSPRYSQTASELITFMIHHHVTMLCQSFEMLSSCNPHPFCVVSERLLREKEIIEERAERRLEILKNLVTKNTNQKDMTTVMQLSHSPVHDHSNAAFTLTCT